MKGLIERARARFRDAQPEVEAYRVRGARASIRSHLLREEDHGLVRFRCGITTTVRDVERVPGPASCVTCQSLAGWDAR